MKSSIYKKFEMTIQNICPAVHSSDFPIMQMLTHVQASLVGRSEHQTINITFEFEDRGWFQTSSTFDNEHDRNESSEC